MVITAGHSRIKILLRCLFLCVALTLTSMYPTTERQDRKEKTISTLNVAITALDVAERALAIVPAKAALSIVKEILAMIRVRFLYPFTSVDHGLKCG